MDCRLDSSFPDIRSRPLHIPRVTRRRSPVVVLLFALLLAFGQQQALSHALEHDLVRAQSDTKSTGHPADVCAKCLVFAHLDHASDTAALAFAAGATRSSVERAPGRPDPAVATIVRYDPRAPPLFS